MDAVESPERLPVGWTEKIATNDQGEEIKFYYNVITGTKFNTKADLLRYVDLGIPSQNTRQQTRAQKEGNTENRLMLMSAETNKTNKAPDWLPQGWIMELNATSRGQKYKTYIDPSTGRKFSSKPSILKYLNSDECNDPTLKTAMSISYESKPSVDETSGLRPPLKIEGSQTYGTSIQKLMSSSGEKSFEIVRCEAKGLPPGWIKEIKIGRQGDKIRKDPYYTDPESKYVFRSLRDALRYLEKKNLKACALEPKRREDLKFLSNDLSISEDEQSLDNTTTETSPKTEGPQTQIGTSSTSIQKLMSSSRPKSFEIVRSEAKGLPPGWIKEIKIEKTGDKIRKDPFFTDPESKYVFRSSLDALRYLETKNINDCVMKPKKREDLKFLSDDTSIPEEKQSLDDSTEECDAREVNHVPISNQPSRTPVSKRKRGKPIASPSIDNFIQHEKPGEAMVDLTKYEGEKVVNEEYVDRDSGKRTEERGERSNLEPQPFERLGGDSSLDPCLEFAFSTLRGDVPVEDNNLPAQSYNHHQRASFNLGFASFSDYARQ